MFYCHSDVLYSIIGAHTSVRWPLGSFGHRSYELWLPDSLGTEAIKGSLELGH